MKEFKQIEYSVFNRKNCRLCGSGNLTMFLRFEKVPFFDEVVTEETKGEEFSYPMELYFCNDCRSAQTQHDVNLHNYYKNYQYIASNSKFMQNYMKALVNYCHTHLGLKKGDKIIEVGAADGYLLSLFEQVGASALGFEAAENLCTLAKENHVNVINALFTTETLHLIPEDFKKAQFFVLLHTFDHLYDPAPFLETVCEVLDPKKGVLLLEVHDLSDIYAKRETALFGHEHATYLHFGSMNRFLRRHGLRIIDFNFLDKSTCRGSSMLIAATPERSDLPELKNFASFEDAKLDELSTFLDFQGTVQQSFSALRNYIDQGRAQGRKYVGYGGWGRGVTTLAMAKLNKEDLEFVVDGNEKLHGCFTPTTGFQIKGPNSIKRDSVDEVIVFNYAYIKEIRELLDKFVEDGGKITSVIDLLSCIK
jgi:2-polyprenyl-3-methyl-5-hydroxy-6-metoxy-1,4-benzoquinol methylase